MPDFLKHFQESTEADTRHITLKEDKEYSELKNELIEIQLGAEEALVELHKHVRALTG